MPRMIRKVAMMLLFLIILTAAVPAQVQTGDWDNSSTKRLTLNIYLDRTGKALVGGYVSDPAGLPFLNASQYRYENDTLQLYALTDALTRKEGDLWNLQFNCRGYYYDYHVTFYLPNDLMLKRINGTTGLEYFLSASNESLVADFQGYEVVDPGVAIEYQQPLQQPGFAPPNDLYLILAVILLMALGSGVTLLLVRRRVGSRRVTPQAETKEIEKAAPPIEAMEPASFEPMATANSHELLSEKQVETKDALPFEPTEMEPAEEADSHQADQPEEAASFVDEIELEDAALPPEGLSAMPEAADGTAKKEIEVSSEMAAVIETLTPRERTIIQALIDAGGKMTQADLRYETRTPKSSLSGILLSLERRKLITKKEWGRTNVIELSEWFLSKKNGS